jgi:hypothetical protein
MENAFLYSIVTRLAADPSATVPAILPLLAGIVSTLKWIALCVITPVWGFAGIVKGLTCDRSWSALMVYALLFIVLLSMVIKPVQDIPPCF